MEVMETGGEGGTWRLLPRGTTNSPNGVHCYLVQRPILVTPGLFLLCSLFWDWAPPWILAHPTPSIPNPRGFLGNHFPKVSVSKCWLVHLASSRVAWPVGVVGGWQIPVAGLLEDWEGHRFLPSPLPPATTGCRLWLPSSPMGGCNRGVTSGQRESTCHTTFQDQPEVSFPWTSECRQWFGLQMK